MPSRDNHNGPGIVTVHRSRVGRDPGCQFIDGKGGGIAAVGLVPEQLGVSKKILEEDYILQVAYLDKSVRKQVEDEHIRPFFVVDYEARVEAVDDYHSISGLEVQPPEVFRYFVKIKKDVLAEFARKNGLA